MTISFFRKGQSPRLSAFWEEEAIITEAKPEILFPDTELPKHQLTDETKTLYVPYPSLVALAFAIEDIAVILHNGVRREIDRSFFNQHFILYACKSLSCFNPSQGGYSMPTGRGPKDWDHRNQSWNPSLPLLR